MLNANAIVAAALAMLKELLKEPRPSDWNWARFDKGIMSMKYNSAADPDHWRSTGWRCNFCGQHARKLRDLRHIKTCRLHDLNRMQSDLAKS